MSTHIEPAVQFAGRRKGRSASALEGIRIGLDPDTLTVEVSPRPAGVSPERLGFLWHRVNPPNGIKVKLTSECATHKLLRLMVQSEDGRWRPRWVRWSYPVRAARELQGGSAVDAQDALAPDASEATLLVLPGETREAILEFKPVLDGETDPGDYLFDVVVQDVTDGHGRDGETPEEAATGILKLVHPRCSLLDMLPAIYAEAMAAMREDTDFGDGTPFFERYLRGFEDVLDPLRKTLDQLDRLFGAFSAPPDFLVWLAAWVSMPLNDNWPEMKRRALIREAVELFRWRGTRRGLTRYLEIYAGGTPEIDDLPCEGMRLGPQALLGTDATVLGDVPPHTFVVTLAVPEGSAVNEEIVRDIIRYEKPAHAAFSLRIVSRATAK
jgi:phage tail-like protein